MSPTIVFPDEYFRIAAELGDKMAEYTIIHIRSRNSDYNKVLLKMREEQDREIERELASEKRLKEMKNRRDAKQNRTQNKNQKNPENKKDDEVINNLRGKSWWANTDEEEGVDDQIEREKMNQKREEYEEKVEIDKIASTLREDFCSNPKMVEYLKKEIIGKIVETENEDETIFWEWVQAVRIQIEETIQKQAEKIWEERTNMGKKKKYDHDYDHQTNDNPRFLTTDKRYKEEEKSKQTEEENLKKIKQKNRGFCANKKCTKLGRHRCAGCKKVAFCSQSCLNIIWEEHKKNCY